MASSTGIVASEPRPAHPGGASIASSDDVAKSLKRQREHDSPSPRSANQPAGFLGSPIKSARLALATAQAQAQATPPAPLTGAAALVDERRRRALDKESSSGETSDNPSHKALASLMSSAEQAMSRPADGPLVAPTANMEITSKSPPTTSERAATSPQSTASMAGAPVTESPTPMDVDNRSEATPPRQMAAPEVRPQPGSMSYPGSLQASASLAETPSRGMSFPMPASPASGPRKHKCPYCETEFTRHHNLKSHLLTHSQEKPYVCHDCQMRFRRLHDLKRHGKLHTGEKPHICPKCDRKFARGDALARHSKGPAGCVGRQSVLDDFDKVLGRGEDPILAAIAAGKSEAEIDELRRQSLPSISAQQHEGGSGDQYSTQSRSYPPAGPRASTSGLFPPSASHSAGHTSGSMSLNMANGVVGGQTPGAAGGSAPVTGGNMSAFPSGGITESPKPLSPRLATQDVNMNRHRSEGRRLSDLASSPGGQPRPKAAGLSHPGYSAQNAGGFARGADNAPSTGSDSNNLFAQADHNVWGYIQTLQEEVKWLTGKVESHDREIAVLKQRLEERDEAAAAAIAVTAAEAAAQAPKG